MSHTLSSWGRKMINKLWYVWPVCWLCFLWESVCNELYNEYTFVCLYKCLLKIVLLSFDGKVCPFTEWDDGDNDSRKRLEETGDSRRSWDFSVLVSPSLDTEWGSGFVDANTRWSSVIFMMASSFKELNDREDDCPAKDILRCSSKSRGDDASLWCQLFRYLRVNLFICRITKMVDKQIAFSRSNSWRPWTVMKNQAMVIKANWNIKS